MAFLSFLTELDIGHAVCWTEGASRTGLAIYEERIRVGDIIEKARNGGGENTQRETSLLLEATLDLDK